MKIALCLRGHMRTFDRCHSYIQEIKKNHDLDIYIHTWDDLGYLKLDTPEFSPENVGTINLNSGKINIDLIRDIYNPVKIAVDNYEYHRETFEDMASKFVPWYNEIKHDPTVGAPRMHSFMSQLYKEQAVIKMKSAYAKKHSIQYDLVIATRPDVLLHIDEDILSKMKSDTSKVYIRSSNGDVNEIYKSMWICNSFFISNEENIDKLGTLYSNIDLIREDLYNIWKTTKDVSTYSIMFCIHRLCWYHLHANNLDPVIGPEATIIR